MKRLWPATLLSALGPYQSDGCGNPSWNQTIAAGHPQPSRNETVPQYAQNRGEGVPAVITGSVRLI